MSAAKEFRTVARWTVVRTNVRTTVTGRGDPEPPKRHRSTSKLKRMEVRASTAELRKWHREARRANRTLSDLARAKLNDEPIRVVSVADPELLGEMRRLGNNLNQLMHAVHGGYPVDPKRVEKALDDLRGVYAQVLRQA